MGIIVNNASLLMLIAMIEQVISFTNFANLDLTSSLRRLTNPRQFLLII